MRSDERDRARLRRVMVLLTMTALTAAACVGQSGLEPSGTEPVKRPAGIVLDPAPDVSGVVLSDAAHGDADFTMVAEPGHLLVVFFGYTACPDVCPMTMVDIRRALRELPEDLAARVEVAMVTVDPDRDTGERLTAYVQSFVPEGHALRTDDPDLLSAAAEAFGVRYSVTTNEEGRVEVGHSSLLFAVDSDGLIRVTWVFGMPSDDIRDDLAYLLQGEA